MGTSRIALISLAGVLTGGLLFFFPLYAVGQGPPGSQFQIEFTDGVGTSVVITDGAGGANPDTDGLPNRIGFTVVFPALGWGARGTLIQTTDFGSARITLTDCEIGHTGQIATSANGFIKFQTAGFAPIGLPADLTGHLDGRYVKVGPQGEINPPPPPPAGNLQAADVSFDADTNLGNFGRLNPPCAGANCGPPAPAAANVVFAPADVVVAANGGVTQLLGSVAFIVGPPAGAIAADGIVLPTSAEVSVSGSLCGNGLLDSGEACDDGNRITGDGCSASCAVEPGATCVGEPSVCTFGDCPDCPTVSEWGIAVMLLLVLTGGTVVMLRRKPVTA